MRLKAFHNDTDLSIKLADFNNSATSIDFSLGELCLGLHKPIKEIYLELEPREPSASLIVQAWNGTRFSDVEIEDGTQNLSRSGFIKIPETETQLRTTLNGKDLSWITIFVSGATVNLNGVGVLLSSDSDLGFVPNIQDYLPEGKTSFISFHQEARNIIIQTIRNSGKRITRRDKDGTDEALNSRQVTEFDILEIDEFRQASKYLALSLLFDFLSKSPEDHYAIKAERFHARHLDSINSNLVSIDENDNGKTEASEAAAVQFIRITRE